MVDRRALKETIKDIPRVAKEQAEKAGKKAGDALLKFDKATRSTKMVDKVFGKKAKKDKGRKYNPNKVIMAKTGGYIDRQYLKDK